MPNLRVLWFPALLLISEHAAATTTPSGNDRKPTVATEVFEPGRLNKNLTLTPHGVLRVVQWGLEEGNGLKLLSAITRQRSARQKRRHHPH